MDSYLRAFDIETGRELWKHSLPAGAQATPMTYRAGPDQRQYVVVAPADTAFSVHRGVTMSWPSRCRRRAEPK